MSATVTIISGRYCSDPIVNKTVPLIKGFQPKTVNDRGEGVIKIDGTSLGYPGVINVRVKPDQFTLHEVPSETEEFKNYTSTDETGIPLEGDYNGETEEQAISRINERFEILNEMTEAVAYGSVRSLIVSGPPGVGKSFGVEETMRGASGYAMIANGDSNAFEVVHGAISPIGLYQKLYEFSGNGKVLVMDDTDDCLFDPVSLSLLKAALDTSKRRMLSWYRESNVLEKEKIPNNFEYNGGMVYLTNLNFAAVRSKLLKPHLDALQSRSHYLDLGIATQRDKFLRIKGVVIRSTMMDEYDFDAELRERIMTYIRNNINELRELSLRTVIKLADLVKMKQGEGWERIANATLLKGKLS